jgi:hypothetical protein
MTDADLKHTPTLPSWTDDQPLAAVRLGQQPYGVRMRIHHSEEAYPRGHGRCEIVPVSNAPGVRDYVLIHPYILIPDLPLQVSLYATLSNAAEVLGELDSATWAGLRQCQIGSGQAWYYRTAKKLILWGLDIFSPFLSKAAETSDPAYSTLWSGFERNLLRSFPQTQVLATPSWEPGVHPDRWHQFLIRLRYQPHPQERRAFIKTFPAAS